MAGDKKRRQRHLRKTKVQLIDELEGLQRELGALKRGGKTLNRLPATVSQCLGTL
ncbi:MAG: hypothetical protein O3B76_07995 [Proteobacteria bacterium]|nr:hypothetical protein [Pseudomonadota bacterium]MDA1023372.1 hypothetical protein [Pseudomonadota bacterium]